jgi:hypothetical protein
MTCLFYARGAAGQVGYDHFEESSVGNPYCDKSGLEPKCGYRRSREHLQTASQDGILL